MVEVEESKTINTLGCILKHTRNDGSVVTWIVHTANDLRRLLTGTVREEAQKVHSAWLQSLPKE
jgi:hypothetical protein